jgi:formate hydrogenlyase subunit 4
VKLIGPLIHILLALVISPFLMGIINRTKAKFAGRKGQPLLQPYYDIIKLLRKGSVYSTTSTWVFRLGPVAGLSAMIIAILIIHRRDKHLPLSMLLSSLLTTRRARFLTV